jgi:hypothetical protein
MTDRHIRPSKDWVMLICAIGLATAFNLITFAVLYDAIFSEGPGLSDNATQVLTGWGGGIIGLLGAYVGYKASRNDNGPEDRE